MSTKPDHRAVSTPTSEDVSLALRHCWQPVARTEDLQHGPQRAVLLGEALAVFLTASGEPAVVADRCAHRGASLSMGKVVGEGVQCPYHGWEWGGRDGACIRIPSLADQSQIPPAACIDAYPAREQWGLIWTVLDRPLAPIPNVPWFDEKKCRWGHGEPFELPVSFGVMIENFRDVAHFAFVHRATMGAVPEVIEPLEVDRDGLEVTMARRMLPGAGGERAWEALGGIRYHTIAPNFTSAQMSAAKGQRYLLHASRAISGTESVHYWVVGLSEDFEEYGLEEALASDERLYVEDRATISAVEPPELPLDPQAGVSTVADKFTLAYRAAFAEFVSQAAAGRRT